MNSRCNIFVYGTLRIGGPANDLLVDAKLIKKGLRLSGYRMFNKGLYPAIVPTNDNSSILGDLYELDRHLLEALDEFEGDEYVRRTDPFENCILYVSVGNPNELPEVATGDWLAYAKSNEIYFDPLA